MIKYTNLENICEVIAGQSPPSTTYNKKGIGLPFYQGKADFGDYFPITRYWCSEPNKISLPEDILISVRAPVGPTNITREKACIGRGLSAIRVGKSIDMRFLLHYLRSIEKKLADSSSGSTFTAITQKDLKSLKIPLPPLEVQKKIAEALDKADAIRKRNQQILEKYDQLAQSVFLEMFGDPVANPKRWEYSTLKEVCTKITDGTHHSPPLSDSGYPYVTAKHIRKSGVIFESAPTYVEEKYHQEIYKRCAPEKGDVLYIKDGATTGVAAINSFDEEISLLSSLALLKPDYVKISNQYLCFWLNNDRVKQKLISEFMSGAAIKRYTLKKINSFKLPIPPIDRQKKFEGSVKKINALKSAQKLKLQKSEALFQSLLQRAFKGELFAEQKEEIKV